MSGIFHHLMAYVFDPFWKYVTLLLHGNGTNGAQNNTFIDSSSNAFTITRNGTPTQGSVSPFGPNWSNSFNGTGDYLSAAANAAWQFGTGNLTVEGWLYLTATPSTATAIFSTLGNSTTSPNGIAIGVLSTLIPYFLVGSSTVATQINGPTALSLNTWVHLAGVRSGSTMTFYVNGVSAGSSANSTNISTSEIALIGRQFSELARYFPGYISNIRVLKGTALYTAAFTPPTAPLTAITNTSLLTCQSNYFKDNSTNNFAITATGTPSVQRFSPFSMGSAYSTSVIGGSGYFNGTSDYLNAGANVAFQFTGSFTVEAWVYLSSLQDILLFDTRTSAATTGIGFQINSSGVLCYIRSTSTSLATTALTVNTWNHVAWVYNGTTVTGYVNGVAGTASTIALTLTQNNSSIGRSGVSSASFMAGYISNLRVVKGTAVYTAAFTPPTAPLTAITNTSILLNYVNGGIYDNAMQSNLITVGNAQISTTQFKFGGASMAFDGTGDWLTAIDTPNLQINAGDFTIEGWVYLNAIGVAYGIVSKGAASTGWSLNVTSGNKLQFSYTASNLTGATSLAASTWYYFAVVRSGTATGNVKIYLNGTSDVTSGTAITDNFNQTSILYVGASRTGTTALNGYIDDLRITKAARYTANFTSPTSQFLDY